MENKVQDMKRMTYRELIALKEEKELELKQIEDKYAHIIKRYWDLKTDLTKLTPFINKAMIRERISAEQ